MRNEPNWRSMVYQLAWKEKDHHLQHLLDDGEESNLRRNPASQRSSKKLLVLNGGLGGQANRTEKRLVEASGLLKVIL